MLIDYASTNLLLYELLYGLDLPNQNFKASLLEEFVRRGNSALPSKPLKAADGSQKQIDAAFRAGRNLVVVECKAVGRSLGVDRGDIAAVRYRNRVVEGALEECSDKARWLASHRSGSNFDITNYDRIVALAVTPFVEFVPSLAPHYWLTPDLPRVLTPDELFSAADSGTLASDRLYNSTTLQ